jgi:hypothetical protein
MGTAGCRPAGDNQPVLSLEHKEIGLFGEDEVPSLVMPDGYQRSVAAWYARRRFGIDRLGDDGGTCCDAW